MKMTAVVSKLVRRTLLAAPIVIAPSVSSVVMQSLGMGALLAGASYAQAQAEKPEYKTKKSYSLRQDVYKEFAKVQEQTDANNWKGALQVLNQISAKSAKFTSYEKANLWNYYGWVYYSLEDNKKAIDSYRKVLKEPELSEALQVGTLYTLAQLLFVEEDYRGAVDMLKQWMKVQPIVGADAYVLLAQGYYQLEDMEQARVNIDKAITMVEGSGKTPNENWYTLQRAVYYDKGDNKKVIAILEKLVKYYPKASYWKQLSGMYGAVGNDKKQLYALETVYVMGQLTEEKELLNLAYLLMGQDVPYKAAKIIDKGIKEKKIEPSSKNLEVLATAWRLAQELDKSIPEMQRAAEKSSDGDLYARLAGIYLDNDQNDKALDAGNAALKRGGVKRPDQLYIVIGMANTSLKKYDAALKAFQEAAKDKRSKPFADQWADFVKGEAERERQLKL